MIQLISNMRSECMKVKVRTGSRRNGVNEVRIMWRRIIAMTRSSFFSIQYKSQRHLKISEKNYNSFTLYIIMMFYTYNWRFRYKNIIYSEWLFLVLLIMRFHPKKVTKKTTETTAFLKSQRCLQKKLRLKLY